MPGSRADDKASLRFGVLGFRGLQGLRVEAESLFWLVLTPVSSLSSCALTISTASLWLHRRTKYVDS